MGISNWVAIGSLAVAIVTIITFATNAFKWVGTERRAKELMAKVEEEADKLEIRSNEQRNRLLSVWFICCIMLVIIFTASLSKRK